MTLLVVAREDHVALVGQGHELHGEAEVVRGRSQCPHELAVLDPVDVDGPVLAPRHGHVQADGDGHGGDHGVVATQHLDTPHPHTGVRPRDDLPHHGGGVPAARHQEHPVPVHGEAGDGVGVSDTGAHLLPLDNVVHPQTSVPGSAVDDVTCIRSHGEHFALQYDISDKRTRQFLPQLHIGPTWIFFKIEMIGKIPIVGQPVVMSDSSISGDCDQTISSSILKQRLFRLLSCYE